MEAGASEHVWPGRRHSAGRQSGYTQGTCHALSPYAADMIRERLGKRIVIAALVVLALFGGLVAFVGFAGESATHWETRLCGPQGCASFY